MGMQIKIDRRGVDLLRLMNVEAKLFRGIRTYFCAVSPYRAIVRVDGGLDLASLIGTVVDGQVGWDAGTVGFVRERNEGQSHTKVTVRRKLAGTYYDATLYGLLTSAPREDAE